MLRRPVIFISAVSKELKTARGLTARLVQSLGYDPKDQDMARTEHGLLRDVLCRWIDQSHGVIQLVGRCYGAEPSKPDSEFGRVSYTQLEALHARKTGKPVWYIMVGDDFVTDAHEPEPEEHRLLQSAYRDAIREASDIRHMFRNEAELENCIRRIEDHLDEIRREWEVERRHTRRFRVAVMAALAVLLAVAGMGFNMGWWMKKDIQRAAVAAEEQKAVVAGMGEKVAEQGNMLAQNSAELGEMRLQMQQLAAHAGLGQKQALGGASLKLRAFAEGLLKSETTSPYDRALALFSTGDYKAAEAAALACAEEALKAGDGAKGAVVDAFQLAGDSAQAAIQYPRALEHYRKAAELTDRAADPARWALVQGLIAANLYRSGKLSEAIQLYPAVVELFTQVKGADHPDTLATRNNLAIALQEAGRDAEAEKEQRDILQRREKTLGGRHLDTASSRVNLATALYRLGRYEEVESMLRTALEIYQQVAGTESPDTLTVQHNWGMSLRGLGRSSEAERVLREVLALRRKVLGNDHPDTISSLAGLADVLREVGKGEEAVGEAKAALAAYERVLGVEHPQTLNTRVTLAGALIITTKFAEAEQQSRQTLAAMIKDRGADHPDVQQVRVNLGISLAFQQKFTEALELMEIAYQSRLKAFGPQHPETIKAQQACETIRKAMPSTR